MKQWNTLPDEAAVKKTIAALKQNGMTAFFVENEEAARKKIRDRGGDLRHDRGHDHRHHRRRDDELIEIFPDHPRPEPDLRQQEGEFPQLSQKDPRHDGNVEGKP